MAVLVVEHGAGEGPYAAGDALRRAGLELRACRAHLGEPVPEQLPDDVEALVVMGGPQDAWRDQGFASRRAELTLIRAALAAELPLLGICLGAQLLAVAAGGAAHRGAAGPEIGWEPVRLTGAAAADPVFGGPLFAGPLITEPLITGPGGEHRVLQWHSDTIRLPDGAVLLATGERYPVQAFRVGGSAWGVQFHLEAVPETVAAFAAGSPEQACAHGGDALLAAAPGRLATLAPWRDGVLDRFAALVAARADHSRTRAFFTSRAADWEVRFPDDGPRYRAAVAELELTPGQAVLDAGCGTGRALPALRAAVGAEGTVLGADLTPAMLRTAAAAGRSGAAGLLVADCARLPLPDRALDAVFGAGLISHLPDPAAGLAELARVTRAGGRLALFHPVGRAALAARHGRAVTPDDLRAEPNLRPLLDAAGWRLTRYTDQDDRYLALAVRHR
ncbi:methyltransferase domain-containing protein [Streptomyces sp. NPDC092296]|uniref:methyltransferase domain-containing protein n=1 Tax=Streptomyces sp. NPDC092296 TaxID=3366012 RepID=UPI00382A407B